MISVVAALFWLMCWGAPVQAVQGDTLDPDQPFEQALNAGDLRSLLSQALDRLEEHIEISGDLSASDQKTERSRYLRFKFYPEGKSRSDQHFAAEGWFRSSPESGQHDWHFKFKRSEDPPQKSSPQLKAPL